MTYQIALVPGDGIGPEVVTQAVAVLEAGGKKYGVDFTFTPFDAGGCAIDKTGAPLPQSTVDGCLNSDGVLLGAVGGPKWDTLPGNLRPERALLGLRSALGVFSNLRPARIFPQLASACPLRRDILEGGVDLLIVRVLIGGIYFGDRGRGEDPLTGPFAWATEKYATTEIDRILKSGFNAALKRRKKLCVVDKANVLESSRLWRERAQALAPEYSYVAISFMYVDNAAMQLVRNPSQFDVIVTSNMFGDVLSDEASQITGSIGMLPSASLGDGGPGLYEPIHGSAPDIAGQDKANPLGTILAAAMMCRYSLNQALLADAIEAAVEKVLSAGHRTADLAGPGEKTVGTKEMGQLVMEAL